VKKITPGLGGMHWNQLGCMPLQYSITTTTNFNISYISAALGLDVLFGKDGTDYFQLSKLPGTLIPGIAAQFRDALTAATEALKQLETREYNFMSMTFLVGRVAHAMELLSTAIASYQGFRSKHLLTEATAVWRAGADIHGFEGAPIYPIARRPRK
jgi:hypothetical protein